MVMVLVTSGLLVKGHQESVSDPSDSYSFGHSAEAAPMVIARPG